MENQILQIIQITSWAGVTALLGFPLVRVFTKWIDMKLNKQVPYDVQKGVKKIQENDMHEVNETLLRIERKLDKLDAIENCVIWIKARINGKT